MDKMKQMVALTLLGALVIAAGGWFLLISPKRSDAAALRDQAAVKEQGNQVLVTQLAQLKAQAKALPAQQAKLAAVAAKIPGTTALPALVRALNAAADDTGVELLSISPGGPIAVDATGPVAGTPTTAKSAAGASVGTLQSIPVALNVVGSYFQVAEYLDKLENLARAFRVTGLSLTPGLNPVKSATAQPNPETGKVLNASINGLVYETVGATTTALTAAK